MIVGITGASRLIYGVRPWSSFPTGSPKSPIITQAGLKNLEIETRYPLKQPSRSLLCHDIEDLEPAWQAALLEWME